MAKFYLVGGSVRDIILGREPHDYDIMVEGSSVEEMLSLGFKPLSEHFPVFFHPVSLHEFALCRAEIKTGERHNEFSYITDDISLVEDLKRRDFTCNAIAVPCEINLETGEISYSKNIADFIDPFGGISDIKNKELKVVCAEHFIEDPLRIIRFCRFLATLGFTASEETYNLLSSMTVNYQTDCNKFSKEVSDNRIMSEMTKAMQEGVDSRKFWETAEKIGILDSICHELYLLIKTYENQKFHACPTTFGHVMCALDYVKNYSAEIKCAVLFHDIYKYKSYKKTNDCFEKWCNSIGYTTSKGYREESEEIRKQFRSEMNSKNIQYFFEHDSQKAVDYFMNIRLVKIFPKQWKKLTSTVILTHMQIWNIFDGYGYKKYLDFIIKNFGYSLQQNESLKKAIICYKADHESDKVSQKGDNELEALEELLNNIVDICQKVNYMTEYREDLSNSTILEKIIMGRKNLLKPIAKEFYRLHLRKK